MTCDELLQKAREAKPHIRYVRNRQGTAIGALSALLGIVQTMAVLGLDGTWYNVPGELFINGKPLHRPEDWLTET